jgi:hypothetical protein
LKIFISIFFENMTIISFLLAAIFLFLHDLMGFCERITVAMNVETNCCENMLITCFASCFEMWNVIWKMRFRFVFCWNCLWWFVLVIMLDHFIVILTNDACLFSIIEWRMSVFDLSNDVYDETSLKLTRHLIKLMMSDSSNLTKATHQIWWMKASSHQIWRKRFIKLDDVISLNRTNVISSNFWKERQFFYLLMSNFLQRHLMWKT